MKKSIYFILFILFSMNAAHCQETDTLKMWGKVIESETENPIAFASIYIKYSNVGTITDSLGNFELHFPKSLVNDSIIFSCIGYSSLSEKVGNINIENELHVELDDSLFLIGEATALAYDHFVGLFWNTGGKTEKRYLLTCATRNLLNIANFIKILKSELGQPKARSNILRWKKIDIKEIKEKKVSITLTYLKCNYCPGPKDMNLVIAIRNKNNDNLLLKKKKEDLYTAYFQSLLNKTFEQGIDYSLLEKKKNIMYLVNDENPYTGRTFGYYESGEKGLKGEYKNGLKEGHWIYWYKNGQKKMEVDYVGGKKNGTWYYWFSNGNLRIESNFINGKMDGTNKWWYESGKLKKEAVFNKGVFMSKTEYDEQGNILEQRGL